MHDTVFFDVFDIQRALRDSCRGRPRSKFTVSPVQSAYMGELKDYSPGSQLDYRDGSLVCFGYIMILMKVGRENAPEV